MSGAVLLGLLGCGRAAERHHVPAIARLTNARLTAAYDPLAERRLLVARSAPGCRPFDSAEALLEARVVDAVLIASSVDMHGSLAVKALGAGLPVLIEPPLAATLEEAEWIREAERIVRLPVMVGFNRRWWWPAERLRRALAGAQEGELEIDSVIMTEAADADPLEALTAHLDLVRHLADREIATVSARRDPSEEVQAQVTLYGGGHAVCRAGPGGRPDERITIRTGSRGYQVRSGSERFWPPGGAGRWALDLVDSARCRMLGSRDGLARSYEDQLDAFIGIEQAHGNASPGTTDGLAVQLAVESVRRSLAAGGIEVAVPATPSS